MRKLKPSATHKASVRVIQSDPEFRQRVVRFVQEHASFYEFFNDPDEAAEGSAVAPECDLLITDLALTPSANRAAKRGLEKARVAQEKPASIIVLTTEPATLQISRSLAGTNTLAYIHRTSILFDAHTQALLQIALRQFEESWQRAARRTPLLEFATVEIDRLSQTLLSSNNAAQIMFELEACPAVNEPWWKLMGQDSQSESPLAYAIDAGVKFDLPPTAIITGGGREIIISGQATPNFQDGAELVTLSLQELDTNELDPIIQEITEQDTIAVLGVDQIEYGPNWSAEDNYGFMLDIRASLLEIVRSHDGILLPQGSCMTLILRQLGIEESMDVCNAVLSHLRSVPQLYGPGVASARFSVGLARKAAQETPLKSLVAANNALSLAQRKTSSQRIRLSSIWDEFQLCGTSYSSDGAFNTSSYGARSAALLSQLTSLRLRPENPGHYRDKIFKLLLSQPGIKKIGIFQKRQSSTYRFLLGAQRLDDGIRTLSEEDLAVFSAIAKDHPQPEFTVGKYTLAAEDKGVIQPLIYRRVVLGFLALEYEHSTPGGYVFDPSCLHYLASVFPGLKDAPDAPATPGAAKAATLPPMSSAIEGYVVDNMEGAVDQATFLAKVDMPVAIIGPRGTGKMYIAKIVHQESGGAEGMVVQIDCREFRSRDEANAHIGEVLQQSEGKTLVFKSPHLLAPDTQLKLSKQLSTRTLADARPARYLPTAKYVALFPEPLDKLVTHAGLSPKLASVFAGYPIYVPPVKDRKQAVLRWAYKILGQESADREIPVKGFTPDAEQAMLSHDWSGNISEMRQCIVSALEKTDKDWITPVDLGIFKGISAQGKTSTLDEDPFLSVLQQQPTPEGDYSPTSLEDLDIGLAEAVNTVAQAREDTPLGEWLDDELFLAVHDRYQGDLRLSAEFLHTKPRNISRRMPKILARDEERTQSSLWKTPRRCVGEWVRETALLSESPQLMLQKLLLGHVVNQCTEQNVATRAKIMGVSVPTYQKRLQQL